MKQLIMKGPAESTVVDVDIPKISDDQLLVRVIYTGMCHSEYYPWLTAKPGDTFGHEAMGIVADKGKNVIGFSIGDRVTGLGGGGYKEYIVMEPKKTMKVPDGLKDEDAVAEPLGCIMSVAERVDTPTVGDTAIVVGAGYMGLGLLSLFRARGYSNVIAVDKREIALENAKHYGATEVYLPEQLPKEYRLNWETWGKPDLTRDGHKADIFGIGFPKVVEFTGTEDGLTLASEMVCAHGILGIAGYHNDGPRTQDFKLWNIKAMTVFNCHERRIEYEATLCKRGLDLIAQDLWKFRGAARHIYTLEEFDQGNRDMVSHKDNFIKGLVRCDV